MSNGCIKQSWFSGNSIQNQNWPARRDLLVAWIAPPCATAEETVAYESPIEVDLNQIRTCDDSLGLKSEHMNHVVDHEKSEQIPNPIS